MSSRREDGRYPPWICAECGNRFGKRETHDDKSRYSTWHYDLCGWCGQYTIVTEPRDYMYPEWPIIH